MQLCCVSWYLVVPRGTKVVGMSKVLSLYGGQNPGELPVYRLSEAAVYLGVPSSTLHAWVRGKKYQVRGEVRVMRPLIKADRETGLLSFNNFVESRRVGRNAQRRLRPEQRHHRGRIALGPGCSEGRLSRAPMTSSPSA
jgi:hypothetical protein